MISKFLEWVDRSEIRACIFYWWIMFPLGVILGFLCSLCSVKFALWFVLGK